MLLIKYDLTKRSDEDDFFIIIIILQSCGALER